ncbi:pyridoxamine 5'-phosphate oxidase family protein [Bizionia gelidisalsuginis]|uniref:Pyridoxamine 5'-phosphate oxidase family protein n=2 Tax=Bizionia TaxID=283785 RepID=A0A8H2LDV5_9FLAO|nr:MULTISPECIES: pyridoxamine 5'-phosphate oxidase family protein [Bizionia]TYB72565.1 pyridoxamine 5'-phosphate oxidase family protein [Bizionia saleffrena]TYC09185.1 pyridoxamine 5'-phosphate oxidase family protein [Bizionia gelidisalsuginis]
MLGELNSRQIEFVLHSLIIGRIGCHADGKTYVVPITYAYDGKYIYGHTTEGLKINMMRKNPMVCFQVDVMENMSNWRSVIAWGKYEELKTREERQEGVKILRDSVMPVMTGDTTIKNSMRDSHQKSNEAMVGVVYRIELKDKTGRYEKM